MPLYRVTFMNHIVETYLVEAPSREAAWQTDPDDVAEREPDRWDCTSCEIVDVELESEYRRRIQRHRSMARRLRKS